MNLEFKGLSRLVKLLTFDENRILFKAFFESQFKYCPLTWMFCNRKTNNRIDKLHEQGLRLVYDDYETSFPDLLAKDGSFTVHHIDIYSLFQCIKKYNLSESCLKDLFSAMNDNLRSQTYFKISGINTVFYDASSIRYFGSVIWNSLPNDYRNICEFDLFNDMHREKLRPTQFCTRMAARLLLTFFICLQNQLSSIHSIITY